MLQRYLLEKINERLPQIITMENNLENLHKSISSCVLDWDRSGYIMTHSLIGDIPVEKSGKGFVNLAHQIFHRQSTS